MLQSNRLSVVYNLSGILFCVLTFSCSTTRIIRKFHDPVQLSSTQIRNTGQFAAVTGLLYLPDMIASVVSDMPGFLIPGAPWIITGSILTIAEGSNHSNILNFPGFCSLEELNKFARFPQGMPPDFDKTRIHLLTDN
jgi:hypothetical protein